MAVVRGNVFSTVTRVGNRVRVVFTDQDGNVLSYQEWDETPTCPGLESEAAIQEFGGRPKPPEKPEDRFPHRCPKCNRKCYLGLNQIEHAEADSPCR